MERFAILNKYDLPYRQRVVDEANELGIKIIALEKFVIYNPYFEEIEKKEAKRLTLQLEIMKSYFYVLVDRINNFN